MYLIIYLTTLAAILTGCLILGIYIYLKDKRSSTNRLFFFNSISLNIIIIFTIFIQIADENSYAVFLQSVYNIFLLLFLAGSLYFTIVFSKLKLNKYISILYTAVFFILSVAFLAKGGDYIHIIRLNGINVYELKNNYFWFCIYSPFLIVTALTMFYSLMSAWRKSVLIKEKNQIRIIFLSILVSFTGGFLFLMIFPAAGIYKAPLLTPYFFGLYMGGVFYSIVRYNFLSFGINDIAREILSQIHEIVVIAGFDNKIIDSNEYFSRITGIKTVECLKKNFLHFIINSDEVAAEITKISGGIQDSARCRIVYKSNGRFLNTDSMIRIVKDRFCDPAAILIVSRENKGVDQFCKQFGITPRELSIISMSISGKSNAEISNTLCIARRTVETHLTNIYNKLSVNNKIELANLASDFGFNLK